jgi:hypothetical protein
VSPLEEAGVISELIDALAQRGRNESDPEHRREYALALSTLAHRGLPGLLLGVARVKGH